MVILPATPVNRRGHATRAALLRSALTVFARDGFHAASTRTIAQHAKANQAMIGYHFRSKQGLYLAVFADIVATISARLGPLIAGIHAALDAEAAAGDGRARAFAHLLQLIDGMLVLMAQEASTPWAQLILREQQAPTAAFTVLYDGFMGQVSQLLSRLVARLGHGDDATRSGLLVVTILGQVQVFRAARAGVLRQLGWAQIGPLEIEAIRAQLTRNLSALLLDRN
jgi:AcrR family transcriptional regulator